MSKYNVALCLLKGWSSDDEIDHEHPKHLESVKEMCNDLKELVDKSTPSKIKHDRYYDEIEDNWMDEYYCPCCNEAVNHKDNYCSNCGQALDWRAKNNVD